MAGIVLCVFFALGVMTGFSETGRHIARHLSRFVCGVAAYAAGIGPTGRALDYFRQAVAPLEEIAARLRHVPKGRISAALGSRASSIVALVEKGGRFYALSGECTLTGPVSPAGSPDLPVLSGPGVEEADGAALVRDAALLVRAEAGLSRMVSEMRVESDGAATLFLDRARMQLVLAPGREVSGIHRAVEVLGRWRGREHLIAKLDLTMSGIAVVRLKTELPHPHPGAAPVRRVARRPAEDARVARADRAVR